MSLPTLGLEMTTALAEGACFLGGLTVGALLAAALLAWLFWQELRHRQRTGAIA